MKKFLQLTIVVAFLYSCASPEQSVTAKQMFGYPVPPKNECIPRAKKILFGKEDGTKPLHLPAYAVKEAQYYLSLYLQSEPGSVEALNLIGLSEGMIGNLDGAIQNYFKAHSYAPNDLSIHMSLARAYLDNNNPKDAIKNYNDMLSQHPLNPDIHFQIANAYEYQKDYILALEHYRIAKELNEKSILSNQKAAQIQLFMDAKQLFEAKRTNFQECFEDQEKPITLSFEIIIEEGRMQTHLQSPIVSQKTNNCMTVILSAIQFEDIPIKSTRFHYQLNLSR